MTSVVPSSSWAERDGAAVELDEAPAHGEPDPGADERPAPAGAGEGRERIAGRRRAVVAQLHADGAVLLGALDLDVARAGGQRDAQQVHEQARDELAVGADDGQAAGADLGAGVAQLAGQPALRGAERLVEGDQLDDRLGAPGRGQVEQVVDEALRALGPGRQAPQGVAQLGIALAALLEHDEVAAQQRDRLAELMRGLRSVGVEIRLGAAVGRRGRAHRERQPRRRQRRPARAPSAGRTRP